MKRVLYQLKIWFSDVVRYPKKIIVHNPEDSSDYDDYWVLRGRVDQEALSDWQKTRADIVAKIIKKAGGARSIGDIGSGGGALLKYLVDFLNIRDAIAYDISGHALSIAKSLGIQKTVL